MVDPAQAPRRIRPPIPSDAPALAALAGELGNCPRMRAHGDCHAAGREQAHAFDAREGYAVSKTSYFLTKALT